MEQGKPEPVQAIIAKRERNDWRGVVEPKAHAIDTGLREWLKHHKTDTRIGENAWDMAHFFGAFEQSPELLKARLKPLRRIGLDLDRTCQLLRTK
jgi:hypothetical protein